VEKVGYSLPATGACLLDQGVRTGTELFLAIVLPMGLQLLSNHWGLGCHSDVK
jgi:hypothetical protein